MAIENENQGADAISEEELFRQMAEAVVDGDDEIIEELANRVLELNIDPYTAIVEGLTKGMSIVSDMYENGKAFVPNLMVSAGAMYEGLDILSPYLKSDSTNKPSKIIIGTVEGDVHDIGKNLVKTMMTAAGFDMIDLGSDVPLSSFVSSARDQKADAISMSTLMTTTMPGMEKVIEQLKEEGLRDSLLVMVGGAPINADYAAKIGADATRDDASAATEWLKGAIVELPDADLRWSEKQISLNKVKYKEELAKKGTVEAVDIGLETAKAIIEEFESVGVKTKESMTHADRTVSAMSDKKVDRLPVYPLACGVLRKFAPVTYKEYATNEDAFVQSAYLGSKYLDLDMFVGLIDLSITSADLGCGVKFPEEDTPSSEGHLEDYEKIEVPEVKEGTRAYELIKATKLAKAKLNSELATPMVGFHEGPLLTLTQLMGASRVLGDMNTNPDVVLKAVDKCADYVAEVSRAFFEEDACDALCIDNLWSNNVIMGQDDYWKFDGQFVYNKHVPVFKEYNQPYIIHNCADAVHYDIQISKFGTALYSYAYYPSGKGKGSYSYDELIPKYGKTCCMMGEVDPIQFLDNSPEGIQKIRNDTESNLRGAIQALKENGFQSKYVMSTGCEIPPGAPLDTSKAMVDVVKELGPELQKMIG
ncbi:TPA: methyltransferase [Methanosarcina acetivorans]|jgi:corrinoid protein of di/trimethylamine methyltransferase|uniref:Methyltransferase n=2 Tax=Methanosarcina acetivorans TaxID=2214 RepID=Q8THF9_METAC|nr:uroporphyrinogen decarboxylase family protein [Methanosarcina acetivorans]AAM07897.1 hypothetical protein (multi-domain) [Methanosarcina acetivorans C2A]HIH92523.1 methyltransferase [Methanosarcina acetivorans]